MKKYTGTAMHWMELTWKISVLEMGKWYHSQRPVSLAGKCLFCRKVLIVLLHTFSIILNYAFMNKSSNFGCVRHS